MVFRHDINFLRAFAVIAVVLFHFFPGTLPGGYLGVDVFFVISGYIITLLYFDSLRSGGVTLREFYLRRIRRLFPLLLLVSFIVGVLCFGFFIPSDLVDFARPFLWQSVYLQNVGFWIQGDYFFQEIRKPLLHTWSLAVEEQFYLFFPLALLLFRRLNGRMICILFAMTALLSLTAGYYLTEISPKSSFFLLPTRAWQLIAGILAALWYLRYGPVLRCASLLKAASLLLMT